MSQGKKNGILAFLYFIPFAFANAQEPTLQWAKKMGGNLMDGACSIAIDSSGNTYTTGWFQGTADFDPGTTVYNLTSRGAGDIFISKTDPTGKLLWAKSIGGASDDFAYGIALDTSGNIYLTGYFSETVDFNPDSGVFNLISFGERDIFIMKLSAYGNFGWSKQIGGSLIDIGFSISTDASGNTYTTGIFYGTADFDPDENKFNLTSTGESDIFILKLDDTGDFIYAKQMGSNSMDWGNAITADASGNVFTAGHFHGTTDFNPNEGTVNLTSAGTNDAFILKLDTKGEFIWAKRIGGTEADIVSSIALDKSGNILTTGYFYGTVDFDPAEGINNMTSYGNYDIFILKLHASGKFLWARQLGGVNEELPFSIRTDRYCNVYTTGSFKGSADFNPDIELYELSTGNKKSAAFISKLDSSGNFRWALRFTGISPNFATYIAIDSKDNIYTTGTFKVKAEFKAGLKEDKLFSAGDNDIFLCKIRQNETDEQEHRNKSNLVFFMIPIFIFLTLIFQVSK